MLTVNEKHVGRDFDDFLYLHPTRWYFRVHVGRDVIERPADER